MSISWPSHSTCDPKQSTSPLMSARKSAVREGHKLRAENCPLSCLCPHNCSNTSVCPSRVFRLLEDFNSLVEQQLERISQWSMEGEEKMDRGGWGETGADASKEGHDLEEIKSDDYDGHEEAEKEIANYQVCFTLSLPSSKSTFYKPFRRNMSIGAPVRIGSIIIFNLSKLWKATFFILWMM